MLVRWRDRPTMLLMAAAFGCAVILTPVCGYAQQTPQQPGAGATVAANDLAGTSETGKAATDRTWMDNVEREIGKSLDWARNNPLLTISFLLLFVGIVGAAIWYAGRLPVKKSPDDNQAQLVKPDQGLVSDERLISDERLADQARDTLNRIAETSEEFARVAKGLCESFPDSFPRPLPVQQENGASAVVPDGGSPSGPDWPVIKKRLESILSNLEYANATLSRATTSAKDVLRTIDDIQRTLAAREKRLLEELEDKHRKELENLKEELLNSAKNSQLKDSQLEQLKQQNKQLELERSVAEDNRRQAEKLKSEAENLRAEAGRILQDYKKGLPEFIDGREDGAHFANFFELLTSGYPRAPDCVDRITMMLRIFAGANRRDDNGFELVWSVHEIGKALYALMDVLGYDKDWQFNEARAWAHALNREGAGRFGIFVPVASATFNAQEMTGGVPQSLIQSVKSWGVRNRRGDVERKAFVK